jgi:hypothetical protein
LRRILLFLVAVALVSGAPVAIVHGQSWEISTISGTISCNGQPIRSGGKVDAIITMGIDPYTGAQIPVPPTYTNVRTSIDSSGHYTMQVYPGIYDLYASASGFKTTIFASGFVVEAGQSLHVDGNVCAVPEFSSPVEILIICAFAFIAISVYGRRLKQRAREKMFGG